MSMSASSGSCSLQSYLLKIDYACYVYEMECTLVLNILSSRFLS